MKNSEVLIKRGSTLLASTLTILSLSGLAQADEPHHQLTSVIASFQPWHEDKNEDPKERHARLSTLARAQLQVAAEATCTGSYQKEECIPSFPGQPEELIALLLTAGFWESRFARHVHAGKCREHECDGGRARSVYQVQLNGIVPREIWEKSEGLGWEPSLAATQAAALTLSAAWRACRTRHGIRGVWGAYVRGRCDGKHQVAHRARWYSRQLRVLRKVL